MFYGYTPRRRRHNHGIAMAYRITSNYRHFNRFALRSNDTNVNKYNVLYTKAFPCLKTANVDKCSHSDIIYNVKYW